MFSRRLYQGGTKFRIRVAIEQTDKKKKTSRSRVSGAEGLRRALEELARPGQEGCCGRCAGLLLQRGRVRTGQLPASGGGCWRDARTFKLELNPSRSHSHRGTGCRRETLSPSPPVLPGHCRPAPRGCQVLVTCTCSVEMFSGRRLSLKVGTEGEEPRTSEFILQWK